MPTATNGSLQQKLLSTSDLDLLATAMHKLDFGNMRFPTVYKFDCENHRFSVSLMSSLYHMGSSNVLQAGKELLQESKS